MDRAEILFAHAFAQLFLRLAVHLRGNVVGHLHQFDFVRRLDAATPGRDGSATTQVHCRQALLKLLHGVVAGRFLEPECCAEQPRLLHALPYPIDRFFVFLPGVDLDIAEFLPGAPFLELGGKWQIASHAVAAPLRTGVHFSHHDSPV